MQLFTLVFSKSKSNLHILCKNRLTCIELTIALVFFIFDNIILHYKKPHFVAHRTHRMPQKYFSRVSAEMLSDHLLWCLLDVDVSLSGLKSKLYNPHLSLLGRQQHIYVYINRNIIRAIPLSLSLFLSLALSIPHTRTHTRTLAGIGADEQRPGRSTSVQLLWSNKPELRLETCTSLCHRNLADLYKICLSIEEKQGRKEERRVATKSLL